MKKFLSVIFLIITAGLEAQQFYDDAQVRAYLNLEKKITRNLSAYLDQQYRFTNNVSEFTRGSAQIGLAWKFNKHFRLQGDYTFIQDKSKHGIFYTRHWYGLGAVVKGDIDRFRFVYRNLFQARSRSMNTDDQGTYRLYDRNKFMIKYEATKRFTFYAAEELYIPLNSPQLKGIERSRSIIGTEIATTKNQHLELFFMYQFWLQRNEWFDYNDSYPKLRNRHYIYGISYNISF